MEQIGKDAKGDKAVKQLFFTKKPDAVYAITTGWLAPELTIRNIQVPADAKVTMLGLATPLKTEVRGKDLVVRVPMLPPEQLPCRYNYAFKLPGAKFVE